ncbi:ParB/RepB/Spo0J family partition protein [Methylocystis heyeri]|uniref:ParB-like N-terminal domain-containing protein n=1 Tax=Methylocystis heyeri TaxID=391905 RepID=A0A6B8KII1_9HYPH|nr:ParB N-terminal domain-containing protein [Methylocystis heyeri]QGM46705.1 hypothetical protein H2LOC_013935 [Methylocystis heyeri]
MQIPEKIAIADIDATDRLRPVDVAHAQFIADSIERKGNGVVGEGLDQPIIVRPKSAGGYQLVIGGHRHWAMVDLGWKELVVGKHVMVQELDDLEAKIAEIDENVARRDLNPLDRAIFIAKRRELFVKKYGETRGRKRKDIEFKEEEKNPNLGVFLSSRFSEETAKRIGYSKGTIDRALHIANNLSEEIIAAIRGTGVETNQQELLALAEAEPEQQLALARKISSGEAKTVLQAKWACGFERQPANDPQGRLLTNLSESFDKASKATRASFMKKFGLAYAETRR